MGSATQHSLLQLLLGPASSSGKARRGNQAMTLFSVWNADCHTSVAISLCFLPAQVTGLSSSSILITPAGVLIVLFRLSRLKRVPAAN